MKTKTKKTTKTAKKTPSTKEAALPWKDEYVYTQAKVIIPSAARLNALTERVEAVEASLNALEGRIWTLEEQ